MFDFLENIDTQLFLYLNGKHNEFFDVVMWWISYKFTWIPFYALLLFLVWKKSGKKTFLVVAAIGLLIIISDQSSVRIFKNIFLRYRPCHNLLIKDFVHTVDGCGGMFGFVSSHAANVFALAMFLSLVFKKAKFSFLIFFWAALTGYSRIYLGVHYPGDIVVGALLGCFIGILVYALFKFASKKIYG